MQLKYLQRLKKCFYNLLKLFNIKLIATFIINQKFPLHYLKTVIKNHLYKQKGHVLFIHLSTQRNELMLTVYLQPAKQVDLTSPHRPNQ